MYRTISLSAAALIAVLGLFATGCSAPEPFPFTSLADQLDPAEPPGPWRLAVPLGLDPAWFEEARGLAVVREGIQRPASELALEKPDALRRLMRSGALIQTEEVSTLGLPVTLQSGEIVKACLRYAKPLKDISGQLWAEAFKLRLLRDGVEVSRAAGGLTDGTMVVFTQAVPRGGADRLEIVHRLPPGTALRLFAADVLVLAADAPTRDSERARRFLEFGGGDPSLCFHGAAARRLIRVSRFGMTARCAVIDRNDWLAFSLPPGGETGRLAFQLLRPSGDDGGEAQLILECGGGDSWTEVTRWEVAGLPAGEWTGLSADVNQPFGDTMRIRQTWGEDGRAGPLGIAEPVLLPPAGRAPDAPNLVLVVLDTLRADRLGCYGYTERPTSERLDRTLEQWGFTLFRRAYTASPWTVPATAKFMASRYLDFHGVRRIPESTTMLAEFLRRKGYYCAAFTGGGMVAVPGMEQGFHEYRWSSGFGKVEGSFPQAGEWLQQWEGGSFFLFVHTYETHRPYTRDTFCRDLPRGRLGDLSAGETLFNREASTVTQPTGEERAYVQAAYDSGVYHACEATADLLDTLQESGRRSRTVVVILSDHGEELWDRHRIFGAHGHSLHAEMLDVPLLVYGPETAGAGLRTVEEPVSTVDLPPTVADLLGIPWEGGADGVSLRPLLAGGRICRTIPIIADLQRARLHPEILPQACVIANGVKYIEPLAPETAAGEGPLSGVVPPAVPALYRLSGDPGERRNLVGADPALAARMRDLLRRAMLNALQPGDPAGDRGTEGEGLLSGELEQQLQALGYLD